MNQQFVVSKEIEFDAGHRVPLHESKCRNPHGHRYRVIAYVCGDLQEEGAATGMVLDFTDIKAALTELIHDKYDHGFIIYAGDSEMLNAFRIYYVDKKTGVGVNDGNYKIIVVDWTPTAEEMARSVYNDLIERLPGLIRVDVYETPTSCATYPYSGIING